MEADFLQKFAQRLSAVRIAFGLVTDRPGLSRAAFAAELGLEKATYRRYERAEMEPTIRTLAAIRLLTGISLDYLVVDEDPGVAEPAEIALAWQSTFGERMRCARELAERDPAKVAKMLCVSPITYRRWESDREVMPEPKQIEFAGLFNVSIGFLRQGVPGGTARGVLEQLRLARPELWHVAGMMPGSIQPGDDPVEDTEQHLVSASDHPPS